MDLHQKEIQGFFTFPVDNLRASPFLIQYIQEEVTVLFTRVCKRDGIRFYSGSLQLYAVEFWCHAYIFTHPHPQTDGGGPPSPSHAGQIYLSGWLTRQARARPEHVSEILFKQYDWWEDCKTVDLSVC